MQKTIDRSENTIIDFTRWSRIFWKITNFQSLLSNFASHSVFKKSQIENSRVFKYFFPRGYMLSGAIQSSRHAEIITFVLFSFQVFAENGDI